MKHPLISVLMPVFNAEKYISEAIDSILTQTFRDFEFIIINDGSTDGSEEIILHYADERIIYVRNESNIGLIRTLNYGVSQAKGKYIARMDADDISLPNRLEYQYKFMELHPDVGICGSWVKTFTEKGNTSIWKYPENHEEILCRQFFNVGFAHPAVMLRNNIFEIRYTEGFIACEDYELWYRLLKQTIGANLPTVLLNYRFSPNQVSHKDNTQQIQNANRVRKSMLNDLGIEVDEERQNLHSTIFSPLWPKQYDFFYKAIYWFELIAIKNREKNIYREDIFNCLLAEKYFNQCYYNSSFKFYTLLTRTSLGKYIRPTFKQLVKLRIKSVLQ